MTTLSAITLGGITLGSERAAARRHHTGVDTPAVQTRAQSGSVVVLQPSAGQTTTKAGPARRPAPTGDPTILSVTPICA